MSATRQPVCAASTDESIAIREVACIDNPFDDKPPVINVHDTVQARTETVVEEAAQ